MKVFVAYSYRDPDRWIESMVFPLIEAFGAEVVTGGETYDSPNIPDGVVSKIEESNALIGFTTRRDRLKNGKWHTHPWVLQELGFATGIKLWTLEVRETLVVDRGGLDQGRQRVSYDRKKRDDCMVEIVKALGTWHLNKPLRVKLIPEPRVEKRILPLLGNPGLVCSCVVRRGPVDRRPVKVDILPTTGGLFIDTPPMPKDSLLRVVIHYGNEVWQSSYQSVDSYNIIIKKAG